MILIWEIEEEIEVINCDECKHDFVNCITLDLELCDGQLIEIEND